MRVRGVLRSVVVVAVAAAGLVWVAPAQAASITVTTTADADAVDGTCSLREAIIAANTDAAYKDCPAGSGADTISFDPFLTGAVALGSSLPQITSTVEIRGPGWTSLSIDGGGQFRVFSALADASLSISRLTIDEAYGIGSGSAVAVTNGSLTIMDASIKHSRSTGSGGAVASTGGPSTRIERTSFLDNTAGVDGGAVMVSAGSLTVLSSQFVVNSAAKSGGAIARAAGAGTSPVRITGSVFAGNSAGGQGGAVYATAPTIPSATPGDGYGDLEVTRNRFEGNSADGAGGAISAALMDVFVVDSTLESNKGATTGGAVLLSGEVDTNSQSLDPTLTVANSTVARNTANSGGGIGVVFAEAFADFTTLAGNSAASAGSNVWLGSAVITVRGSVLADPQGAADANCSNSVSAEESVVSDDSCGTASPGGITVASDADIDLGPLGNNGGPTWTMLPGPHSVLIDAASGALGTGIATDQRGQARSGRFWVGSVQGTPAVAPTAQSRSAWVGFPMTGTEPLAASGLSRPVTYTVAPDLPGGLSVDASTGVVSGTPTETAAGADYTITASGALGRTAQTALTLDVSAPSLAPALQERTEFVGRAMEPTTALTAVLPGTVAYTVSPALPAGLALDPSTGVVSGAPVVASGPADHTVRGTGAGGVYAEATLSLRVLSPSLAPASQTVSGDAGTPIPPTQPLACTGCAPGTTFAIAPELPAALAFDRVTGVLSGTPAGAVRQEFTVSAVPPSPLAGAAGTPRGDAPTASIVLDIAGPTVTPPPDTGGPTAQPAPTSSGTDAGGSSDAGPVTAIDQTTDSNAVALPVEQVQRPRRPLGLPGALAPAGVTRLVRLPVVTNAGQPASVSATCSPRARGLAPSGDVRPYCRIIRTAHSLRVWVSGQQPVVVRVSVRAAAVPGYTAYRKVVVYRTHTVR